MRRVSRAVAVAGVVLVAASGVAPPTQTGVAAPPGDEVGYAPPVTPVRVARGFAPPVTRYGAGHLGVDLAVAPRAQVRAAGPGVVRFAGSVAGRGVVVLVHPDGVSTEYEPLSVTVRAGVTVAGGTALGRVHGTHGTCAADRCLHWGARRDGDYFDPLVLLRPLGPVRLLPYP